MIQSISTTNKIDNKLTQFSVIQMISREFLREYDGNLQKLIAGCLLQNRKDQKMLYKAFYGFAMKICIRYASNRYEAVEIMNQGFLKVFAKLKKHNIDHLFISWVGLIMVTACINYYSSSLKSSLYEDQEVTEDISNIDLPEQKLNYDDLLRVIQQLPTADRIVFNLFAIEGFSHDEIAAYLSISTSTSKSTLYNARAKLKIILNSCRLAGKS